MGAVSDPPSYDEQIGMTFTQSFTSMAYNVTAVIQSDPSSGVGPAYLLNGLSDTGYWYQVGLSYNWDGTGTYSNYSPGFNLNYEVFDSSGNSIYPASGGGGTESFSGPVNSGDTVLLNLYFSSTYGVVMFAKDHNTGASAYQTYSAEGGSEFVGLPSETADSNGFFTGLMTEWYHASAFYGNVASVRYSNPNYALTSAWMWIDEFSCSDIYCSTTTSLFSGSTPGPVTYSSPSQMHEFALNGASEASNGYTLITGPAYVEMTVSYSVSGGTSPVPPVFQYSYNSGPQTAVLTQSPATYTVDAGTSWSVTSGLPGSSQTERWSLVGQESGVASSSATDVFLYQHQYLLSVSGGSGGTGSGWYDSGATATATTLGVFGRTDTSGQRVVSYSVDGSSNDVLPTSGTVSVSVLMDSPHQLAFDSVEQYALSTPNGSMTSVTPTPIQGDVGWYDSGSEVTVIYSQAWDVTAHQSRLVATGYTVNAGNLIPVSMSDNGTFAVSLKMTAPETVSLSSTLQYYVSFAIMNDSGLGPITPTSLEIQVGNHTQMVAGMSAWMDNGTTFTVPKITYEGANVSPLAQTPHMITNYQRVTIDARVYNAKVKVTDLLGSPVGGAQFTMKLVNGTSVTGHADANGVFEVPDIPLGNYTATVTSFGLASHITGDASTSPVAQVRVALSSLVALVVVVATAAIGGLAFGISRSSKARAKRKTVDPGNVARQGPEPAEAILCR